MAECCIACPKCIEALSVKYVYLLMRHDSNNSVVEVFDNETNCRKVYRDLKEKYPHKYYMQARRVNRSGDYEPR